MTTRTTIAVAGATGGAGTTTLAVALAAELARHQSVRLHDLADVEGIAPTIGVYPDNSAAYTIEVAERLTLCRPPAAHLAGSPGATLAEHLHTVDPAGSQVEGVDVVDLGRPRHLPLPDDDAAVILALRGPSYTGLRHALTFGDQPDALAVLVEPGRALDPTDAAEVLGLPVTAWQWDPAIARVVDAGTILARLPHSLARTAADLAAAVLPERIAR